MTVTEPEVYSTPDTVVEEKVPNKYELCPLLKEICVENNCKFWFYGECLIVTIMKEMIS